MSSKPELQPPSQPRTFASDPDASRFKLIALIGFAILSIGAFVVVIILPGQVAKSRVTNEAEPVQSEVRVDREPTSKTEESQEKTETRPGSQGAKNLPQELEQVAKGQIHEDNGEMDSAKQMHNGTISPDKDFQSAHDYPQRVDELILERDFRNSMSDAISALSQNKIGQAKHSLDIARKLRPDDAGVRDLEQELKNTGQRVKLQRLEKEALRYEQTEQWEKAVKTYTRVLKIDANTGFAQQGKLRAEKLAKLNRQVQNYLSNPDDLQAQEHMSHARKIYKMAVAWSDIGPKLRDKTEKLRHLLELYNKPISILVQSDDITDVRIFRVSRLGHFLEHRLKLRPGRYKALGTRSGYRDVSILFTVPVDGEEMTLTVYCKEKI